MNDNSNCITEINKIAPRNVLFKQLNMFFKENNYNFEKYTKNGYKIHFNFADGLIEIFYNNKTYKLEIFNSDNEFYWHLSPYKNSFFKTKVNNEKTNLDYVLCAIKEDI